MLFRSLGRPFMATTKTIIDVHKGELSMTMLGETVQFSVSNALLLPSAAYIEDYMSELDQYMENFFEDESVMYLGSINEDSVFWDDLLMEMDAGNASQSLWLLEESESRNEGIAQPSEVCISGGEHHFSCDYCCWS